MRDESPPIERHFYPNLESLRGIAALAVVLHHLPFPGRISASLVATQSWLFVDFFFVLSGFVIALVHFDQPMGVAAARRFLIRRLFRLYPLHLATLALVAAMLSVRIAFDPSIGPRIGVDDHFSTLLAANLLLVQAWGFSGFGTLNVPSWSISTEWLAYLVSAAIVATIALPAIRLAALALVGAAALAGLILFNHATLDGDLTFRAWRCLYAFALGAIVWRVHRPMRNAKIAMTAQLVCIAAIIAIMRGALAITELTLLFPPIAALLVGAAAGDHGSMLRRVLISRPARWIGERSYSIYLVHTPVFMFLAFLAKRGSVTNRLAAIGSATDVLSLAALLVVVMVAALTYRWIEAPWREWGRRLTPSVVATPSAVPSTPR